MGRTNIAFLQSPTQGSGGNKCADVTFNPPDQTADLPVNVSLATTQTGGHIFYLVGNGFTPKPPVHNGDNAIAPTVRVGGNTASVFISNNGAQERWISAVCYQAGFLDSNITSARYAAPSGPL